MDAGITVDYRCCACQANSFFGVSPHLCLFRNEELIGERLEVVITMFLCRWFISFASEAFVCMC